MADMRAPAGYTANKSESRYLTQMDDTVEIYWRYTRLIYVKGEKRVCGTGSVAPVLGSSAVQLYLT